MSLFRKINEIWPYLFNDYSTASLIVRSGWEDFRTKAKHWTGKVATYDWVPFLLVATQFGFTQLNSTNCGKLIVFHVAKYMISTNWTQQNPIWPYWNPPFQVIWDLLFKFHRPGAVFRWRVQIILLTSWVCPHQKKQAYGLVRNVFVRLLNLRNKNCTSFNRESLSFQCSRVIFSWWKGVGTCRI